MIVTMPAPMADRLMEIAEEVMVGVAIHAARNLMGLRGHPTTLPRRHALKECLGQGPTREMEAVAVRVGAVVQAEEPMEVEAAQLVLDAYVDIRRPLETNLSS
jgi:hypothetical protein